MSSPILVTGGTGTLGRLVVPFLAEQHPVRVLSRGRHAVSPGVEHVTADLLSGEGLDAALADVHTVVHLAGGRKGDDRAARNLLQEARSRGVEHVVAISVVGADRMPVGYFRMKLGLELALASGGIAWSLVRAAQFQESCYQLAMAMAKMPAIPVPNGIRLQPVAAAVVANRIADLALGPAVGRVDDVVGPTTHAAADVVRDAIRARGKHRLFVPIHVPGKAGRAYRDGLNLAQCAGTGRTWDAYLAQIDANPTVAVS